MISLADMVLQEMFEVREELEKHIERAKKETREYFTIYKEMNTREANLKKVRASSQDSAEHR